VLYFFEEEILQSVVHPPHTPSSTRRNFLAYLDGTLLSEICPLQKVSMLKKWFLKCIASFFPP
jgi:hypothetical protein